jgi:MFS family permease
MKGKYPDVHPIQYETIKSILNTAFNGGGFLCTLTSTVFINNFDRRSLFLGFSTIMMVLSFVQSFLPLIGLYIVRCFIGYIAFFYSILCPMIVTETLPETYTGSINSTFFMFFTIGVQSAFFIKGQFAEDYYYIVYCIPIVIEIIRMGLFLIFFNIETPRYIYIDNFKQYQIELELDDTYDEDYEEKLITESMQKDQMTKKFSEDTRIKKFLKVFYKNHKHKINTKFLNSEYFKQISKKKSSLSPLKLAFSKEYRKQTFIGLLLNLNSQLSGINIIVFYSKNLFAKLGFSNPEGLSSIVNSFNVLGSILNIFTSDRIGRKKQITIGMVMISISYIINMIGESFGIPHLTPIGNCMFIFSFAISLGGLLYVYQVEILPGEVIPIVSIPQLVCNLLVGYFGLPLLDSIGIYFLYFIFFFGLFISWFVFGGMAVESKGKTLSQMKSEFAKKKFWV